MSASVKYLRILCVYNIKRRRQHPIPFWAHEKRNVLNVVVLVSGDDINDASDKLLPAILEGLA